MPYLVAAVVLLGVLCVVNLLFTLGILRRLRAQATWTPTPVVALSPGSTVGEFSARTTTGEPVSRDAMAGRLRSLAWAAGLLSDRLSLRHFSHITLDVHALAT